MASRISHIHWLDRFFEPPSRELQQSARHPDASVATKTWASLFGSPRALSGCPLADPGLAGALISQAAASWPHEAATNSVRAAVDALATTSPAPGTSVGWHSHAAGFGTYLAAARQSIIGSPSISSELS
jgi:hypothetical protein